jgi:hypothetical protein
MIHFKALILRLFGETEEKQEKSQLGKASFWADI